VRIRILAGQYFDSETGLHYNYHRYYDPKTGRYLTPDPIGLRGGINLYSYTSNNPINRVDPKGLIVGQIVVRGIVYGAPLLIGALGYATGIDFPDINIPDIPYIPSEDEAEDILHDILEGNYPAPALPMSNPNDDIYDGWDWWKDNVGEQEKCDDEGDDEDRCKKIRDFCIDICSDTALPSGNRGFKFWNCLNQCMEEYGCL
jgi:RHS repeat-associated protein